MLGTIRGPRDRSGIVNAWLLVLQKLEIDILYVIGGNGSLTAANELDKASGKEAGVKLVVAGIPKTMDNDILWTDQSFGYQSAIDEAARIIRALREDAFSTRRICIIKLFGRGSGFVAAAASLASGCVDAVLVPEEFETQEFNQRAFCEHLRKVLERRDEVGERHAVVVVAEGVKPSRASAKNDVLDWLKEDVIGDECGVPPEGIFVSEPRHLIRAIVPNPFDHILCERLADVAVDNALAGYTGFVVTRWLSSFVLVPLRHVADQAKTLPINGQFWRQVVNATGQPVSTLTGVR